MILGPCGTPGGVILEALEQLLGVLGHLGDPGSHPNEKGSILGPLEARKSYPNIRDFR